MTTLQQVRHSTIALAKPPSGFIFGRVMLAIDFGSASLGAARWATVHVARHAHGILSHVIPLTDVWSGDADTSQDALPALRAGLGGFAATLELASARTVVRVGHPSHWLSQTANDAEASLVVLGRRGDANRKRIGEPNVIERLARRTSASVLVVPEGTSEPPRHVIAAVDESRAAPAIVRVARQLALLNDCPLTILHVLSPMTGEYDRVIRSARHMLAGARNVRLRSQPSLSSASPPRGRWLEALGDSPGALAGERVDLANGDPAREIAAFAVGRGQSLVVVGRQGADGAPLGSLGSVARELLTRAPVPVLAVRGI